MSSSKSDSKSKSKSKSSSSQTESSTTDAKSKSIPTSESITESTSIIDTKSVSPTKFESKSKSDYIKYIRGSLSEQLDEDTLDKVTSIYKRATSNSEVEFMLYNFRPGDPNNRMGFENFLKILEYLNYRNRFQKLKLENTITLDVAYLDRPNTKSKVQPSSLKSFRVSINGAKAINKYTEMLHKRNNHVIFSVLVNALSTDKDLTIIKKTKTTKNIVDIDDYNVRVRMAEEEDVSKDELKNLKSLDQSAQENISFRYKQRASLIVLDNKDVTLRIDLTNTKTNKDLNRLARSFPSYELEIDLSPKIDKPSPDYLLNMYKEATTLLKILQQSNYIISRSLESDVVNRYAEIMGLDKTQLKNLEGRKAQSLEIQHSVDHLPNNYAVTDKADGERNNLIIHKNTVFFISDNLHVKNTGIILSDKHTKYNDTLLDGELIFITKRNRHVFMTFDCMFNGGKDVRKTVSFMERLAQADEVISQCFVDKDHVYYKINLYKGDFNIDKILKFHGENIVSFMKALNKDIDNKSTFPLIRRKYFIPSIGAQDNEIFKYSLLMWQKYVLDTKTACPYILDGLVMHPLNQAYITKDTRLKDYKWKPPDKNSIDFFIKFERRRDNNKILTLYDDSREDFVQGKPYRIANLHVGKSIRNGERPVLFQPNKELHTAHLFLQDGEVRDEENNIIQDNTVVEAYYNNDPEVPVKFRWVILRTRFDKTESVQRFGIKHGNYSTTADKIWRSIENPFLMDDIAILSNDATYAAHMKLLRSKIDHSVIMSEAKENAFYKLNHNLAKPMRSFHNWLKSTLIYTYCSPTYDVDKRIGQLKVLDIGCGKGGDIMKFYYPRGVSLYVGIDYDVSGLTSPTNGAWSRYNQLKENHPNFPQMYFIHGDGGAVLDYDDQLKSVGSMTEKNAGYIKKFFSREKSKRTMFDRINSSFAVHFMLKNDTTWNNFVENINMYLKPGGYLMFGTMDSIRVIKALQKTGKHTIYYNDKNGDKQVIYDIVRKYPESVTVNDIVGPGAIIDVHNPIYSPEGEYIPEYLVDLRFIKRELAEKCNMILVDDDLFENQYYKHQEFFKSAYMYESNVKTKDTIFTDTAKFFNNKDAVNNASFEITKLNRMAVFKKMES